MYEYTLFVQRQRQPIDFQDDDAAERYLKYLNRLTRDDGWRVCGVMGVTLVLERSTEAIVHTPIQPIAPTPTFGDTRAQRNQLIEDVVNALRDGPTDDLRSVFTTIERALFHVERLGYTLVPPPKA